MVYKAWCVSCCNNILKFNCLNKQSLFISHINILCGIVLCCHWQIQGPYLLMASYLFIFYFLHLMAQMDKKKIFKIKNKENLRFIHRNIKKEIEGEDTFTLRHVTSPSFLWPPLYDSSLLQGNLSSDVHRKRTHLFVRTSNFYHSQPF